MKQVILAILFFFSISYTQAQDPFQLDSLEEKPALAVQVVPYAQWNEVFGRQMAYAGADAELIFKDRMVVGIFGEVMLGTFVRRIVFPNIYELSNYKYGVTVGCNFPIGEKLVVLSRVKLSQQQLVWTEEGDGNYTLSDRSMEIRPLAGFNYFVFKKISLGGSVGYNIAEGVNLSGIQQSDMNGLVLSLSVGIKI